jgi:hypothetical protein
MLAECAMKDSFVFGYGIAPQPTDIHYKVSGSMVNATRMVATEHLACGRPRTRAIAVG